VIDARTPVCIPKYPRVDQAHTITWARFARELFTLSGVLMRDDDPEQELWRRLDYALEQLERRLTKPPSLRGKRLYLKGWVVRQIEALAEHFQCTRPAVIRQLLRQCPLESFPGEWVADDAREMAERQRPRA
jgi:hypothetical protein